jgi:8-oxo-dGTP diphosphatase
MAAGGIVLRQQATPLIAVVRLRKRNEWVLPKGKLDDGETPRAAAEREVLEETGHDVAVHEFLGTLVYESGGRSKIVHYWRMEAEGAPSHELMDDVKAVDWLPLEAAVERLSRSYERAFLANVGPMALEAAAKFARRPKAKQPVPAKRPGRRAAVVRPPLAKPMPAPAQPDVTSAVTAGDRRPLVANDIPAPTISVEANTPVEIRTPVETPVEIETPLEIETAVEANTPVETKVPAVVDTPFVDPAESGAPLQWLDGSAAPAIECEAVTTDPARGERRNLVQKMRDWLRRAA